MPEQMVKMISKFITWLPDMDILLNEDDECRLVIPWAEKQELLKKEEALRKLPPQKEYVNWFLETPWAGIPTSSISTDRIRSPNKQREQERFPQLSPSTNMGLHDSRLSAKFSRPYISSFGSTSTIYVHAIV
jgi:hypothetical protein